MLIESTRCVNHLLIFKKHFPCWKFLLINLQTDESSFPELEIQVEHLGNHDFRVEVGGLSMNVCLAVYSKVKPVLLIISNEYRT